MTKPVDDVLVNKAATIERCVARVHEEYSPETFHSDITRQDSVILNLQRACEAAIDMGTRYIRLHRLGVPQSARDVFVLLQRAGVVSEALAVAMQAMVGFRNVAVHDYQQINLNIAEAVIGKELPSFVELSTTLLGGPPPPSKR